MAEKTLQLVPKPPDSELFYLECIERKPGEIDKLREFFNRRLTTYIENIGKPADIVFSELFTAQKRNFRKDLRGIRILADGLSDEQYSDLDNLMHTLEIDVVSRIMGVTRGQYSAELKANFNLETTAETAAEQLKTMPNISSSTSHNSDDIGTLRTITVATASLMASGNPATIAAVYRVMEQIFTNLQKSQGKFYYTHAVSFSK